MKLLMDDFALPNQTYEIIDGITQAYITITKIKRIWPKKTDIMNFSKPAMNHFPIRNTTHRFNSKRSRNLLLFTIRGRSFFSE